MKNKRLIAGALTLLLSLSLAGCDLSGVTVTNPTDNGTIQTEIPADPVKENDTEDVNENKTDKTEENEEDTTTTVNPASVASPEEIYSDVLEEVINYIATAEELTDGYTGIGEIVMYDGSEMAYKEIGFLEMDVTGDDIPELIIADPNYEFGASNILQLYTIVDGKAVQVVEGWARNKQYLLKDGRIYNEGSSGAGSSTCIVYKVNSDGTISVDECYFTDYASEDFYDIAVYKSNGSLNKDDAEKVDMSEEDFWLLQDSYLSQASEIEFIPLSNFTNSVVADEVWGENFVNVPYTLIDISTDEASATYVQIYANKEVKNVNVLKLSNIDFDNDGNMKYDAEVIGKTDIIKQFEAVLLKMNFMGDLPEYAISFTDDNGESIKVYTIGVSGMDGSIYLDEIE